MTTKREVPQSQLDALASARESSIRTRRRNRLEKLARELNEAGYTVIRPCDIRDEEGSLRTSLSKVEYAVHILFQLGVKYDQEELCRVVDTEPWLLPTNNSQHARDETGPEDLFSPEYLGTIDVSAQLKALHPQS